MSKTDRCPHCGYEVSPAARTCGNCGKGLSGSDLLAPRDLLAPKPPEALSIGSILLLGLAFLLLPVGLLFISQATFGVGVLIVACLLAIAARIAQAGAHHKALMYELTKRP
jgi:zinc-ribbon domain